MNKNFNSISLASMPSYNRAKLKAGIVHIGVGNFHRAHQAWYLHRLMAQGLAHDWAIIGAGVRPYDESMRKKLTAQDYLTTLIELSPNGTSTEIIGSMIGYVPVQENNAALIAQMSHPDIRIVSLTVTEGGYFLDPVTMGFDGGHRDILHDAANPNAPKTAFGAMIAALKNRRDAGVPAFACQSCDNLQGNGNVLRQTIIGLAGLFDPELAEWIDANSSFPNSMVDSIVPATGPHEMALALSLGIEDAAPVTHEDFRQWVMEDKFCAGRPPWEKVGVTISPKVHDYEKMKIRILNGGHQLIAAAGDLLGIETISGCMENELVAGFFNKVEREEIMVLVMAVPEFTPEAYVALIEARFSNPKNADTTRRVAFDGSSRHPCFILSSVLDCLARGISPVGLALVCAIWARYCVGLREDGSPIEPNDPNWDDLQARAIEAKSTPSLWIENQSIYGNLARHAVFAELFEYWMDFMNEHGLEAALRAYLET